MNSKPQDRLKIIGDGFSFTRTKKKILKTMVKLLPGYKLRPRFLRWCHYHIGENVFIGEDLIIIDDLHDSSANLAIEDRVAISPRVTIVLFSTPNWSNIAQYIPSKKGKITIKKDAWIGTGAVILPDITIGEGSVIGANSVVIRDVPPHTVYAGVPAKFIKSTVPKKKLFKVNMI